MTGTIVGLAGNTRTGTIRSQDGSRPGFSAADVLGDFDTLAVGHLVSFDLDRARPHHIAVRVFREPIGESWPGKKPDASPDLRYAGFNQAENIRSFRFDAVACGHPIRRFVVTVDLALMLKHHIGVQEAPALCLRKLAADLKAFPDSGRHELGNDDLLAYASSRAAAIERKKAKHSFAGRRGSAPPGPSNHMRVS
ncbi:MAG: hypothetical protein ABSE56_13790 [Bryobacteraceae bacterium]